MDSKTEYNPLKEFLPPIFSYGGYQNSFKEFNFHGLFKKFLLNKNQNPNELMNNVNLLIYKTTIFLI